MTCIFDGYDVLVDTQSCKHMISDYFLCHGGLREETPLVHIGVGVKTLHV